MPSFSFGIFHWKFLYLLISEGVILHLGYLWDLMLSSKLYLSDDVTSDNIWSIVKVQKESPIESYFYSII